MCLPKTLKHVSMLGGVLLAMILFSSLSAAAARQVMVLGTLVGASDVEINGTLYDVDFRDGSCITLYSGCDDEADFIFTTLDLAIDVAKALVKQVILDTDLGPFDSDPGRTAGCTGSVCTIFIPFSSDPQSGDVSVLKYHHYPSPLEPVFSQGRIDDSFDTSPYSGQTYVRFTPSEGPPFAVPQSEPPPSEIPAIPPPPSNLRVF